MNFGNRLKFVTFEQNLSVDVNVIFTLHGNRALNWYKERY